MLTLLLCFISSMCMAQNTPSLCDKTLTKEFDEIDGVDYIYTKTITVRSQQDSATFKLGYGSANKTNVYFIINFKGDNMCIDTGNAIYILFNDGTRLELTGESQKNCLGRSIVTIDSKLSTFKTKKIKAIRVYTSTESVDVYLPDLESSGLTFMLNCLCNNINK